MTWRDNRNDMYDRLEELDRLPLAERLDVDAMTRLAEQIAKTPLHLDMGVWIATDTPDCGTVACAAGWAVILDGADWEIPMYGEPHVNLSRGAKVGSHDYAWNGARVGEYAQCALGLSGAEAEYLFHDLAISKASASTVVATLLRVVNRVRG